ncbi:unnamed protein product, partial [Amoebophrya sp. A25]
HDYVAGFKRNHRQCEYSNRKYDTSPTSVEVEVPPSEVEGVQVGDGHLDADLTNSQKKAAGNDMEAGFTEAIESVDSFVELRVHDYQCQTRVDQRRLQMPGGFTEWDGDADARMESAFAAYLRRTNSAQPRSASTNTSEEEADAAAVVEDEREQLEVGDKKEVGSTEVDKREKSRGKESDANVSTGEKTTTTRTSLRKIPLEPKVSPEPEVSPMLRRARFEVEMEEVEDR